MPRRSLKKQRAPEPQTKTSGAMTLLARVSLEALVIAAIILGLFHWAYGSAPLPTTLAAIVAIILALATDYFVFGRHRDRAG
jgi:hypothetical protein